MQTITDIYNRIDHATYGLAEMLLVGGIGAVLAIALYFVLAAAFWGYLQLFALITS